MQDRFEQEQEAIYQSQLASRKKKKSNIRIFGSRLLYIVFANLMSFIIYMMFFAKLVNERRMDDLPFVGIMLGFSIISNLILCLVLSLLYGKDSEENRRLLNAFHESDFSFKKHYFSTLRQIGWAYPLASLIFQLPFMLFYLIFGYEFQAGLLIVNIYMPQLFFVKQFGGVLGVLVNALVLGVIYAITVFFIQKHWIRDRFLN